MPQIYNCTFFQLIPHHWKLLNIRDVQHRQTNILLTVLWGIWEARKLVELEQRFSYFWTSLTEISQILKADDVKVLHSICQQIWKTQQWPQDWKKSVFIPVPKKSNAKEYLNYCSIALILYPSNAQNSPSQALAIHEPWTSRCSSWF